MPPTNTKNNKRLKILIVSDFYPTKQKPYHGSFIDRWARQLVDNRCEVDIFTIKSITPATYIRSWQDISDFYRTSKNFSYYWNGLKVTGFRLHLPFPGNDISKSMPILMYRSATPLLDAMFSENAYDLIYLSGNGGPFAYAISQYARTRKIPYIASAIGKHIVRCFNKPESYAHKREKEILLHSKLVVCVSHDMDIKVRKMTNERIPTLTFYYGVDANRLRFDPELRKEVRSKLDLNDNNPAIVFVGFQKKHKGIYELIQSFRDISYIYPLARLILVGEIIEPRRIKRAIAANGLTSKVILTGGVPYEDILGYLNAADVFAFPSWEEGLPNAVMEACACELPIVASNVGGIPEMIQHEKNGLLISPRDVSGLTKNIKRLLEFPDKARELGVAAREKILKDFDYNKNGKILADRMYKLIYDSNAIL